MLGQFQILKAKNRGKNLTAIIDMDPMLDSVARCDYGVRCYVITPERKKIVVGAWFKPQHIDKEEVEELKKDFNVVSNICFIAEKFNLPATKTAKIAHSCMS